MTRHHLEGRMTRLIRSRRNATALLTVLALLLPVAANATVPAAAALGDAAYIDPNLTVSLATGAAPALLSWDGDLATRDQVADHLRAEGVAFTMFSHLSMAVVCAGGRSDAAAAAAAPGALSVWGDETMTPAMPMPTTARSSDSVGTALQVAGMNGKGVGIAVLDTGIDGTHEDLEFGPKTVINARVIVSHLEIMGPGNDTCAPDTFDEGVRDSEIVSGQGTALAGIAAGDGSASSGQVKGVAPGADLIGLNVADQTSPQYQGDVSFSLIRFIAGVNYVISKALDGGPTIAKVALIGWTSTGLHDPWHPHALAIRDLHDFGITPIVPVGNGGPAQSKCDATETCTFNRLAAGGFAVAVGATPRTSNTTLESYSSRGDSVQRQARDELVRYEPTIVAPGTGILGARRAGLSMVGAPVPSSYPLAGNGPGAGFDPANPSYQAMTGTSVAAAQVAGTVALMQQAARAAKGCYLTSEQVHAVLRQTASPMAYERWEVGAGALDPAAAVAAAQAAPRLASPDPWVCPPSS